MGIEQAAASAPRICANDFSNYLVGGNLCNAFAIGEVGSADDFFLVGAPPAEGNGYPVLTGNLLDVDGKPLARLVRNVILENPGNCSKRIGEHIGFEIRRESGQPLLKVETTYLAEGRGQYVTTLEGEFHNKRGDVAAAFSAEALSFGKSQTRSAIGFTPSGFGMGLNLNPETIEAAKWSLMTGGAIHRLVKGEIVDQDVSLDGTLFLDAIIRRCRMTGSTLDFGLSGNINLAESNIQFDGQAAQFFRLAQILTTAAPPTQLK